MMQQESNATEFLETVTDKNNKFYDSAQIIVEEHIDNNLLKNEKIVKKSVKKIIWKSPEDSLPPHYLVRILYDVIIENDNIEHRDSLYTVDFGLIKDWRSEIYPIVGKLVKVYDDEYRSPYKDQYSYGIACRQGFVKIVKDTTDNTVCVKPETAIRLFEQKWAKINYLMVQVLRDENYESQRVMLESRQKMFGPNNTLDLRVWNIHNSTYNYDIQILDPNEDVFIACSILEPGMPLQSLYVHKWSWSLTNKCNEEQPTALPGKYQILFSSEFDNIKQTVTVTE